MSFDAARAIFNQVDVNGDGAIDQGEFSSWAGGSGGYGGGSSLYESSASYGAGGYGGGASAYESSASYGVGGGAGYGAGYGGGSSYESASYESSGYGGGAYGGGAAYAGGAGYGGGYSSGVSQWATDSQGLFQDPNPQIIRRPAAGGVQTYTQNIRVRFLQPPPVPPPGPLIIREVRPPQPPVPPPLRIRQQAPPLPQPPPLVLREQPPRPPASIASQTVIRRLAALPVPPRSVIIERLPPLPPRPRDVIIDRWVPYGPQAKRRTIVQRAGAAKQYASPRNVIIQYEPAQVRVVRQFQRLGVTQASPAAYVQQYGGSLLDASSLVQQARSAGVVEDISAPAGAAYGFSAASYGQDLGGYSAGFGGSYGGGYGGGSSSYEESSYSSGGGLGYGGAGYSSSSYGASSGFGGGVDVVGAAFRNADSDSDGGLNQAEFARFFQQGL